MNDLVVLVKKDLLEQWRTKKVLILAIIFLFAAIASPIVAKITPEILKSVQTPGLTINLPTPTYRDSIDQFIKNISQIALLVVIFVVAGAISDEKNKKTLEIVLTKPVSRAKFVLSKYLSYFLTISAVVLASSLIFYAYTVSTFASFGVGNFALMCALVLLYTIMITSVTILASTVVRNAVAAGGIGFVCYILFGVVFQLIESIKKYSPNIIFSNYQKVVTNGWQSELLWPNVILIAIILASIAGAVLIFQKQEVER